VGVVVKHQQDSPLIGGSCVLQPKGHSCVGICSKWGDECCFDLVFFLESNVMVTRVAIKGREQDAASCRVNDLVDEWEHEGILWIVFVEISVIHTHPSFIIILF
jgi:hypothetical protein